MKITQLVEIKTKTPYHESVVNRLPRGIKTQQQFLNLSYTVAVRDLGLSKAKSLNENFAAKLINSYHQQSLNEGVGSFLGKMAGHAVGGLGSAWKDAKAGYNAAKGSWDTPDSAAGADAAPGATPSAAGGGATPSAAGGGATPSAAGGGIGDIMKVIDKLDPASKKQLAGELDKSINSPLPASNPAPAAPASNPAPAAPASNPAPEAPPADVPNPAPASNPAPEAPPADVPNPPAATPNYGGGQTQSPAPSKVNYAGMPQSKPLPQATSAPGASNIKMNYSGMAAPKPAVPAPAASPPAAPAAPQFKGPKVNGLQVRNMGEGRKLKFRSNFLGIDL